MPRNLGTYLIVGRKEALVSEDFIRDLVTKYPFLFFRLQIYTEHDIYERTG